MIVSGPCPAILRRWCSGTPASEPGQAGVAQVVAGVGARSRVRSRLRLNGRVAQHGSGDLAATRTGEPSVGTAIGRSHPATHEVADFVDQRHSSGALALDALVHQPARGWWLSGVGPSSLRLSPARQRAPRGRAAESGGSLLAGGGLPASPCTSVLATYDCRQSHPQQCDLLSQRLHRRKGPTLSSATFESLEQAVQVFARSSLQCLLKTVGTPRFGRPRYSDRYKWARDSNDPETIRKSALGAVWLDNYDALLWEQWPLLRALND